MSSELSHHDQCSDSLVAAMANLINAVTKKLDESVSSADPQLTATLDAVAKITESVAAAEFHQSSNLVAAMANFTNAVSKQLESVSIADPHVTTGLDAVVTVFQPVAVAAVQQEPDNPLTVEAAKMINSLSKHLESVSIADPQFTAGLDAVARVIGPTT